MSTQTPNINTGVSPSTSKSTSIANLTVDDIIKMAIDNMFKPVYKNIKVELVGDKIVMKISKEDIVDMALRNIRSMVLSQYPTVDVHKDEEGIVVEIPKELVLTQVTTNILSSPMMQRPSG